MLGITRARVWPKKNRGSGTEQQRYPFQKSAGPVKPPRHVPPYLPISCNGLMTSGSCPMRSATGGSLPALTISASWGASLNFLGNFAGSVMTSGPSSLPIQVLLDAPAARAAAATTHMSAPTRGGPIVATSTFLATADAHRWSQRHPRYEV